MWVTPTQESNSTSTSPPREAISDDGGITPRRAIISGLVHRERLHRTKSATGRMTELPIWLRGMWSNICIVKFVYAWPQFVQLTYICTIRTIPTYTPGIAMWKSSLGSPGSLQKPFFGIHAVRSIIMTVQILFVGCIVGFPTTAPPHG